MVPIGKKAIGYDLLEAYKTAKNGALRVYQILPNLMENKNFIWERRNLQQSQLTFSYRNFEPNIYHPIATEPSHEFSHINGSTLRLAGIHVELILILMEYLNFTIRLTNPNDGAFGSFDKSLNRSNGIVGQVNTSQGKRINK